LQPLVVERWRTVSILAMMLERSTKVLFWEGTPKNESLTESFLSESSIL
jgi:hypothetical protein